MILFISTLIAGSASLFLLKKESKKLIKLLLSFSGAFLLSTCVLHLIPEIYNSNTDSSIAGLFVLSGFLLQIFLEFFSGGTEHGHIHLHDKSKLPLGIILSLCVHAFWEGVPFGFDGHEHQDHLLTGILLHKLPVAFVIGFFLKALDISKIVSLLVILAFSLMPVLGSYMVHIGGMGEAIYAPSLAIVLGMMLHISTTILFESSENHHFNTLKISTVIIGFALSYFAYSF